MNKSINVCSKVLNTLRLKDPKLLLLESCNDLSQLKIIHGYMINPHHLRHLRHNLSFPFLVRACSQLEAIDVGIQAHGQVIKHGFENDVYVQNSLVHMYSTCGDVKAANEVFKRMACPNVVSWTSIMAGFNKIGDVVIARELFDKMPERNLVTWSTMISGYAKNDCFDEAVEMFEVLKEKGVKANETVMVSVISSYAHLGAIGLGEKAHDYIVKNKLSLNVILGTALVDMYARCGCIEKAIEVFNEMPEKDVLSWTAVIAGLAMHGYAERALCHGGLVERGLELFESMKREYRIKPRFEHYGCVVDLLGRAGKIAEAEKFVLQIPVKPNAPIWGALLGACWIHKNAEIAERVGNILIPLLPKHSGYYVLLSNIYARTNRWENVEATRQMMKEKGVKKQPGYSLIEFNGKVHKFTMGEKSHTEIEMIERTWDKILQRIRLAGYTGNTSDAFFDIDEEEKESALHRHSEKLAIAYGIMRTKAPTVIRIVKNLRVCEDCHHATKLISMVFGRELIVRDRNRFHHFREGSCSCMDYWLGLMAVFAVSGSVVFIANEVHKRLLSDFMNKIEFELAGNGKCQVKKRVRFADDVREPSSNNKEYRKRNLSAVAFAKQADRRQLLKMPLNRQVLYKGILQCKAL
ncbi:Pentatricopeptide repeat-containing protein [Hibiscus syriacus]|uniref:Pentatricopeptide repeat-containing protein n=1 Tax=Hibiscus syriacus TaxID=106335 RepID=A0A6A2WT65_HIBSY|nr:Pentatricopeptide repeat-containing protein [Hibiscus syriacus]